MTKLTVKQAAARCHLNHGTLRQAYRDGRLRGERVPMGTGSHYRILFHPEDLDDFVRNRFRPVKREALRTCPACKCLRLVRSLNGPTCDRCGVRCCQICAMSKSSAVTPWPRKQDPNVWELPEVKMERETLCPTCARAAGWIRWEVEV